MESVLREGNAQEEIKAVSEDMKADLIVIGTHGPAWRELSWGARPRTSSGP